MYRKRSWRETLRTRTLPGWIPVCAGWLRIITVRAEPMAMSAVSTRRPLVHPSACGGPRPRLCVLVVVVDPRARGVACGLTTWCGHRVGTSSRVRGRPKVSSVLGSSPCVRRGRLQIRDDLEDLGFIPLPAPAPLSLNHCLKATCGDGPGTASRNCQPIRSSDPHSLGPLPSPSIVPSVLLTAVRRTAFCWRSLVA